MNNQPKQLVIRRPDDWHTHLRDDDILNIVLPYTSAVFGRAIVMPNLVPPIISIKAAIAYYERILSVLPKDHRLQPLMTCYLTDSLNADELEKGFISGIFRAAKFYPANSTTNSSYGVTCINSIASLLERMQQIGMPLLVHSEVIDNHTDIFDREARFIETVMEPLRKRYRELKIVFEHISTKEAVQYVERSNKYLGATITPQHLMFNRNHMLSNGFRPHLYCLPVLKRNTHQEALRKVVASGNFRFFLGTDSAPHLRRCKESSCGCAGIFNAPTALPAYATVFEEMNALQHFESFCSENGSRFYGLPLNKGTIRLIREPWKVTESIPALGDVLVPFLAGEILNWRVA